MPGPEHTVGRRAGERTAPARLVRLTWHDRAIPLQAGTHFIGREPGCAVQIDATVVSRRHARLVVDELGVTLEDLGSHNGTFVNGERLEGPRRVSHGDEIRVGSARIVLHEVARDGDEVGRQVAASGQREAGLEARQRAHAAQAGGGVRHQVGVGELQ